MPNTYSITGASGNTGKIIADSLLSKGQTVRAIGRSAENLASLKVKGASLHLGDVANADFLTEAFQGAQGVYAMIPPNMQASNIREYQNEVGKALVQAIRNSKVTHVVALSSVGAHLPEKGGVVQGLYDFEKMLQDLTGTNVLVLRPSYFMENLIPQTDLIKQFGMMGSIITPDLKFPMVATVDIGNVAAKRLLDLSFTGHSVEYVLGARDVSYQETAAVLGAAIGKPDLQYMHFPDDQFRQGMLQMGLGASFVDAIIEFCQTINGGSVFNAHTRNNDNTTPTSIEEFSKTFAHIYNS